MLMNEEISPLQKPQKQQNQIDLKVKVALRVRPLITRDMTEDCEIIVECDSAEKHVRSNI